MAATSQPSDCITNTAMVFPTYLSSHLVDEGQSWSERKLTHRQPYGNVSLVQEAGLVMVSIHGWR